MVVGMSNVARADGELYTVTVDLFNHSCIVSSLDKAESTKVAFLGYQMRRQGTLDESCSAIK
eukprot:6191205-Pleurochrysis_carterae.AAC.3